MKKYLNSVEEVVKALKEGKKIYDIECECYYYMEDNIIYGYYLKLKNIIMNDSIVFNNLKENPKFYTEEPEPLKFEVNRAYKTRNGDKVFLDSKSQIDGKNILLFVGMKQSAYYFATDIKGKYINAIEHPHDIINYWEEEK